MSAGTETFGGGDHVEVLVEDMFVEEYDHPHPLVSSAHHRPGHHKSGERVAAPRRFRSPILAGLGALGGLLLATLLFRRGVFARRRFAR